MTIEKAFSSMKNLKRKQRNKMRDDFLSNSLVIYIEKDIASRFSSNVIMDEFESLKGRKVQFS